MNHLTDTELIEHILKFDEDPIRIRLAKIMDEMPGFILQRLEDVGMDSETCMFENCYDPGDYINHLKNEIEYLSNQIQEAEDRAARLETMTVLEFMQDIKDRLRTEQLANDNLKRQINNAFEERDKMKDKLSMWAKLNSDPDALR